MKKNEEMADMAMAAMLERNRLLKEGQALAAAGTQDDSQNALTKSDNPTAPGMSEDPGGPEQGKPWEAGGGKTMESVDADRKGNDTGSKPDKEDSGGGQDSTESLAETLAGDQAQAALTKSITGGSEGIASGDIEGEANKMIGKANHVLLQFEQNVLLAFDSSTFGLTLPVTTLFRLPIAAFLAFQLRKVANGQKGGFFNLTADSFMPPGAEPPPLPPIFVYVAVMAYLMAVVFMALILGGLLGLIIMAFSGQATLLGQTFSFFKGLLGI